ncbi:MAG: hypothetical protein IBJ09_14055 [Bacteroidia bacterium]|nr:hypothetical protein [Bacteroidia bacterium]
MKNKLYAYLKKTRYYLLALGLAFILLNIMSYTGLSAFGSAEAETFSPDGSGTHTSSSRHNTHRFYHK